MSDLLKAVLAACDIGGDSPALTSHRGRTLCYRQLGAAIVNTAQSLVDMGFGPGDRMLFSVRPDPSGIVLALGTVAAGGSVVFLDPGVGDELFGSRLAVANARWAAAESVLYAAGARGPLRAIARRRGLLLPSYGALPVGHLRSGPWLPGVPLRAKSVAGLAKSPGPKSRGGTINAAASIGALSGPGVGAYAVDDAPEQPAVTIFTSGTTGEPKAVVHTRGSLGAALAAMTGRYRLGPANRVLTDQLMLGLPALTAGAHWTLPPFGFSPRVAPEAFAKLLVGATHTFLVPADLSAVLGYFEKTSAPAGLRQILVGSAPVLPALLRRAAAIAPQTEVLAVYGMTEILPVSIATAAQKLEHTGPGDHLGTLIPDVAARISEEGELILSGPNICAGYLTATGMEPVTEIATGDLARIVGRELILLGRSKDMIIRGDKNIYPGLYEAAITALPGVSAAMMVGVPDEIGDEAITLVLVGEHRPGRSAVLKDHPLAAQILKLLPKVIDTWALPNSVLVVTSLPTSGRTSKPDRRALAALVAGAAPVSDTAPVSDPALVANPAPVSDPAPRPDAV